MQQKTADRLVMLFLFSLLGIFIFCNSNINYDLISDKKNVKVPKVSVIVPVYKSEKWIRECVDSLINQTLEDIEIICIDDGSPDNCKQILDEYEKKDNRIKVIHKPNGGVGSARNAGLDIAKGEYISFVDSDDYLEKEAYKFAYEYAKKDDIDILQFHSRQFDDGTIPEKLNNSFSDSEVLNLEQFLDKSYASYIVWNNLFKNDLIKQDNIRFLKYSVGEDTCFAFSSYARAKKFKILDDIFYNYRQHNSSTMKTSDFSNAFYKSNFPIAIDIYNSWKSRNLINGNEFAFLKILSDTILKFDERLDEADEILKMTEEFYNKIAYRAPEWMKYEMRVLKNASKYNNINSIEDGIYKIESSLNPNLVLGVKSNLNGSNLKLLNSNDSDNQKFEIKRIKNCYSISPLSSKKLLDVKNGVTSPGAIVQQWGTEPQFNLRQWYIVPCEDDCFKIVSRFNCLNLDAGNCSSEINILCQNDNDQFSQKFKIIKVK